MRLATPLAIAVLAAALLAGCGGSSSSDSGSTSTGSGTAPKSGDSTAPIGASAQSCDTHAVAVKSLRATGVSCGQARQLMFGWQRNPACASPQGASRSSARPAPTAASVRRRRAASPSAAPGRDTRSPSSPSAVSSGRGAGDDAGGRIEEEDRPTCMGRSEGRRRRPGSRAGRRRRCSWSGPTIRAAATGSVRVRPARRASAVISIPISTTPERFAAYSTTEAVCPPYSPSTSLLNGINTIQPR